MHRIVFLALLIFSAAAEQVPVDFSGIWRMDAARSESAHQGQPTGSVTLIVKQSGNDLSIETRHRDSDSPEILTYRLDGTETTAKAPNGTPITSKAHWEGPKLVIETAREISQTTVTTSYVYSLDAKRKEMTVERALTVQHGYQGTGGKNTGTGTDVFIKTVPSGSQ